jgi:hypothetical protein
MGSKTIRLPNKGAGLVGKSGAGGYLYTLKLKWSEDR